VTKHLENHKKIQNAKEIKENNTKIMRV